MGCTCSHQELGAEKKIEMQDENNLREEKLNENKNNEEQSNEIDNFPMESNFKENNEFNDTHKLRGAPPQSGFESKNNLSPTIKGNNNEEKPYFEIKTDKINENDFNELIEEYPQIDDDIIVEKRVPKNLKKIKKYIMENGQRIQIIVMVEVYKYGQMEKNIQGIGKIIKLVGKVNYIIQMEMYMKENG